jgi:protein-S-isoprenylcysteine O-methyltransferase Ste14/membrane-associated phospholipid phosphatase
LVHPCGRWTWTLLAGATLFIALAVVVSLGDVPAFEQHLYESITGALPEMPLFTWITRFGSEAILLPAVAFGLVLLPREFFRRWWLWAAVVLAVTTLEGLGKDIINRPRPEAMRPGFPSNHVAVAAAVYLMAAYFAASNVNRRWFKYAAYCIASFLVLMVALSRIVLRLHWPLDVLGGAALGVAEVAAAVRWHEAHPVNSDARPSVIRGAVQQWAYRWQTLIPIPFFAVLFTSPIGVADDSLLDAFFDLSGGAFIGLGLILRMWARGHAGRQRILPQRVPTRLPTSGPYGYTRQPLLLGNVLVSLGLVLFAENGNGFVLIPVVLLMLYRFTVPFEEARLAERFGGAYIAYRANVPVVPRWTAAMTATASGKPSWRSVASEMPIIAAALLLAALIEGVPFFQNLLR